jgi:DNA-binding transcriptional LysR family regulator
MVVEININQLRCFHAVAKTGRFSSAAEELRVSQPAVFTQVRALEQFVGFKLLEKLNKVQVPTEGGKLLLEYAEKIFTLLDQAMSTVQGLRDLKAGVLRIGAARAVCQYLMPPVVSLFQDEYPLINVHLDEGPSEELLQGILHNRYEIAIMARVDYPPNINVIPFTKDDVLLVVSPKSELAKKGTISFEELAEEPVICADRGTAMRTVVEKAFEAKGLRPQAVIEATNTDFIKHLVKQNRGYTFISRVSVRKEIRNGELVALRLGADNVYLHIDVIHVKGKILSPVASTFLNFLQANKNLNSIGKLSDTFARKASAGQGQASKTKSKRGDAL